MLNRIALAAIAMAVVQPANPADLAAQMTGRWMLNAALSDQGRGSRRGGGPAFALTPVAVQRGARGGSTGNVPEPTPEAPGVTPAEAAAQRALAVVQDVPPEMTIQATPTQVIFQDPRGDSVFEIDNKSKTIAVPGGTIKVKSRWERAALRQEFSSTMRVLHRSWSLDANGRILVLKQRMEGVGVRGRETQTMYDRQ